MPRSPIAGATGKTQTFARSGAGATDCNGDFGFLLRGTHSPYTGAALEGDLDAVLAQVKPTDIYTHSTFEGHTDHREVARQVTAAVDPQPPADDGPRHADPPRGDGRLLGDLVLPVAQPVGQRLDGPGRPGDADGELRRAADPGVLDDADRHLVGSRRRADGEPDRAGEHADRRAMSANLKYKVINTYVSQHGCSMPRPAQLRFPAWLRQEERGLLDPELRLDESGAPTRTWSLATSSLESYWRLDETSGVVAHSTAGSVNGTHDGVDIDVPGLLTGDTDRAAGYAGSDGTDLRRRLRLHRQRAVLARGMGQAHVGDGRHRLGSSARRPPTRAAVRAGSWPTAPPG